MGSAGARGLCGVLIPTHAGDAIDMGAAASARTIKPPQSWADENRLVDLEMVEQADHVAGEMLDVIVLDGVGARSVEP